MRQQIIGLAALCVLCATAQEPVRVVVSPAQDQVKVLRDDLQRIVVESRTGGITTTVVAPVKGAPYSGDEVTEFTQTLGDGTRIQRQDKVTVYRDSQGRIRRETPNQITITDMIEGASYTFDPVAMTGRKTAVFKLTANPADLGDAAKAKLAAAEKNLSELAAAAKAQRAQPAAAMVPVTTSGPLGGNTYYVNMNQSAGPGGSVATFFYSATKSEAASESLGKQTIEGVAVEGTRTTETIPTGAIGNDRPIAVVNERWFSPDLNTVVLTRRTDPRTGEETFRLTNIRQSEPSSSLFQAPAGYRITETTSTPTPFNTPGTFNAAPTVTIPRR